MKKYTFSIPKNSKTYKDNLLEKTLNAYPWLNNTDKFVTGYSRMYDFNWYKPIEETTQQLIPLKANIILSNNLETEFFNAIDLLRNYSVKYIFPTKRDYDFKTELGVPVKIFDNFVQIGYDIIPIYKGSLDNLKADVKKTVINITIKINSYNFPR